MNTFVARRAQRGLALITAVLIVAIIAGVATTLGLGQQVWLRQTENLIERTQADSLRYSALGWVAVLLTRDGTNNQVDHLGELWARQLPPLPTEGGMIAVSIRDAQGLFNLNSLVRNGNPSPPDIGLFQRLLSTHRLDPALAYTLVDWIDSNSEPQGGAEDVDYLALPVPYRAANQLLTSVDELRLVRGFTPAVVETLRPLVTVLPEASAINVNTAIEPVLAAFLEPAGALPATVLGARERKPVETTAQFVELLPPGSAGKLAANDVKTGYFLVTIGIRVGRLDRRAEALIKRPSGGQPASVLWHRLNPLQPQAETDEET